MASWHLWKLWRYGNMVNYGVMVNMAFYGIMASMAFMVNYGKYGV